MTNTKSTKRALLVSVMAMVICFTMLLGTTFAWFTDSKTNSGNIIQSGTLKATFKWADGSVDAPADDAAWNDAASADAIFTYDNWEPGYVYARHIKVENVGSLAFNYDLRIVNVGATSSLTDVIDVYVKAGATIPTRNLSGFTKVGNLTTVMGDTTASLFAAAVRGSLEAEDDAATTDVVEDIDTFTIVFKMQETAGNEYQNLTLGNFSVKLYAVQKSSETDSIDNDYDKDNLNNYPNS